MRNTLLLILLSVLFLTLFSFSESQKIVYLLPEEYELTKEDLTIVFLDVGQGDCSLIVTPNKKTLLIDAGGSPYWMGDDRWDPGEEIVVPYLLEDKIKTLNMVVVSHPHGDHFGGMFAVLNSMKVINFIDGGYPFGDPDYEDLLHLVENKKIPYTQFKEGDELEVDKDVNLLVFYPPKEAFPFEGANNSSLVFKIMYINFSLLFTGDIEIEAEHYISSRYKKQLRSLILKVPHHGSRTSSSPGFIKYVSPEVAVIQCGRKNMFGHPHSEVVTRYEKRKIEIYRTDLDGTIKILTDGYKYTIITSNDND
ncbi:MAG: MBL fold metallo-hydrolase [Endomicrobia bacterium]|nr:MBL fold metallo-hydrolase [Endomicrobiia bacterium]MDW8055466.1 ComEC/Rec2 family competence protein [Elusimicrobiota bacterium]